jgi:hypothetical protein
MQTLLFRRALGVMSLALVLLAACTNANDPYAKIKGQPLIEAHLHTVTLVSDDAKVSDQVQKAGYQALPFAPNYPAADEVQGVLWDVPPAVAKSASVFKAPGQGPNLRLLVEPLPPAAPAADSGVQRSFFRNVLGTEVPSWPEKVAHDDTVRVHVWTYQVRSVVEARKKLRENAIPVVTEPVAITTPYLGDQKSMSLRAPDGTIVELVETAAQ